MCSQETTEVISKLSRQRLDKLCGLILDTYTRDNRPWIIGYSGGKDSTATLQLVWYALSELSQGKFSKPVYVISSDTYVALQRYLL
jgi:DNA sulfur modification protein DndC